MSAVPNAILPYMSIPVSNIVQCKYIFKFGLFQIERRVVSQLALAQEREMIQRGCRLHLRVSHPADEPTTSPGARAPSDAVPTIKLQASSGEKNLTEKFAKRFI